MKLRVLLLIFLAALPWTAAGPEFTASAQEPARVVANAQATPPPDADLPDVSALRPGEALPADPQVRIGRLDNGLVYYVRRNTEPANRAELRLVVNAGSLLEAESERGMAHFLEHMLFNGTRRFKGHELVNFLERIGMEFGPDVNAYTSFDETVYMLKVATDNQQTLATAFDILEDWADSATLDPESIQKERGVIVEEWRLRDKNASGRIRDKILPVLLGGSQYAERLPIGAMEVVRNAPPELFRKFYDRWYRPDLMAVVAVGDFDVDGIETLIRARFSSLEKRGESVSRQSFDVPGHRATRYIVVTDAENPSTSLQVSHMRAAHTVKTVGDFREELASSLVSDMLNTRLFEASRRADSPFVYAVVGRERSLRPVDFYSVSAQAQEGRALEALEAVMTEVERARRLGFGEAELQRSKNAVLRLYERQYNERAKTNSAAFAQDYAAHYLTGEAIPGVELTYALAQRFLPGLTLADVDAKAAELVAPEGRAVIVTAPGKQGARPPSEAELAAALGRVQTKSVDPYVDSVATASLVEKPPLPVEIVSEREIPEIGLTEIVLANKIRVLMKPTDFKNDEVVFSAFSPGGNSLVADADYPEARVVTAVVAQSGAGAFDLPALNKLLYDKQVSVSPGISELGEGFNGRASPRDLETLFQLVYLYATAPRADKSAFEIVRSQARAALANRSVTPGAALQDALVEALYGKTIRRGPLPVEEIDRLDFDRAAAIYRERFADLGDATFVFVGSFDVDRLKTLARTYLGALPSGGRQESWRDVSPDPPAGVVERSVYKGQDERSIVQLVFTGPISATPENRTLLGALERALAIRIREELREERSGIYSPSVHAGVQKIPESRYTVSIGFACDPKRVEELIGAVFALIDDVRKNGPSTDVVAKVKEQDMRALEEQKRSNYFWLGSLERLATTPGEDLLEILRYDEMLAALTGDRMRQAAEEYLPKDRYVKVVLYPEAFKRAE
jgi:zinc protease